MIVRAAFYGYVIWLTLPPVLLPALAHAQRVTSEAYVGRPYGVGRLTIPLARPDGTVAETRAYSLDDRAGRLMYPAFSEGGSVLGAFGDNGLLGNTGPRGQGRLLGRGRRPFEGRRLGDGRLLDQIRQRINEVDSALPRSMTVYFLFRDAGPLQLVIEPASDQSIRVVPSNDPDSHRRLLQRWWREYNGMIQRQEEKGDYPPVVETYLSSMLATRLGVSRPQTTSPSEPRQALELVLGTEKLRQMAMQETLAGRRAGETVADLPVPAEPVWPELRLAHLASQPPIEPIANYVPEECLYIRFGSFANYLWMNQLLEDYGGDISRLVKLRGHKAELNERLQRQLALKQTALAELLGGQVISDVALIGRDLFLREGAAMGILFEARNALLGTDINRQRNEAKVREQQNGATMETVEIGGHDVSFLSTPGNRLRSFYAIYGNYHLVTTSREIVERFLEAAEGKGALGQSAEFANARSAMPVSREDTIFVYLSSRFFQGLAGPQYQIELRRRLRAVTDIELLKLARQVADAEGQPRQTLAQLIDAGLLPAGFDRRPDGSHVQVSDGAVSDSLRGDRGTFLPVTDVPPVSVTREEAEHYGRLAAFCQSHWQQTDPVMVGIKRWALESADHERIAVDAWMLPFDAQQYGMITSMIGAPNNRQVTRAAGDVVSLQAILRGGPSRPSIGTHHLFFGLQDMAVDPSLTSSGPLLQALGILRSAPGYLGAWPKPGYLDLLPVFLRGQTDARGYSQGPVLGLWRRQFGDFSVLSFVKPVLESVTPQLTVEETDSEAQVRIRVVDLTGALITGWLNDLYYKRARQTSVGNARFLHTVSQQLGLPRPEARVFAEDLLDVQLTCALGGDYRVQQHPTGLQHWVSSSWKLENQPAATPASYQAPVLDWFRGLSAEMTMHDQTLQVHAELDMKRQATATKIELPFFNSLFGNKSQPEPIESEPTPKPKPPTPIIEARPAPLPPPPPIETDP